MSSLSHAGSPLELLASRTGKRFVVICPGFFIGGWGESVLSSISAVLVDPNAADGNHTLANILVENDQLRRSHSFLRSKHINEGFDFDSAHTPLHQEDREQFDAGVSRSASEAFASVSKIVQPLKPETIVVFSSPSDLESSIAILEAEVKTGESDQSLSLLRRISEFRPVFLSRALLQSFYAFKQEPDLEAIRDVAAPPSLRNSSAAKVAARALGLCIVEHGARHVGEMLLWRDTSPISDLKLFRSTSPASVLPTKPVRKTKLIFPWDDPAFVAAVHRVAQERVDAIAEQSNLKNGSGQLYSKFVAQHFPLLKSKSLTNGVLNGEPTARVNLSALKAAITADIGPYGINPSMHYDRVLSDFVRAGLINEDAVMPPGRRSDALRIFNDPAFLSSLGIKPTSFDSTKSPALSQALHGHTLSKIKENMNSVATKQGVDPFLFYEVRALVPCLRQRSIALAAMDALQLDHSINSKPSASQTLPQPAAIHIDTPGRLDGDLELDPSLSM